MTSSSIPNNKGFQRKLRAGQQVIVTDKMRALAKTYFVLSNRGTNYRYIGPAGEYQKWYYIRHKERKNASSRQWVQENYEYNRQRCKRKGQIFRFLEKIKALQTVVGDGEIKCSVCGNADIRVLTVNHLNGDGKKDRDGRVCRTYRMILDGRPTIDLDVRCQNCNILHEYDLGRRVLPENWEALWLNLKS